MRFHKNIYDAFLHFSEKKIWKKLKNNNENEKNKKMSRVGGAYARFSKKSWDFEYFFTLFSRKNFQYRTLNETWNLRMY